MVRMSQINKTMPAWVKAEDTWDTVPVLLDKAPHLNAMVHKVTQHTHYLPALVLPETRLPGPPYSTRLLSEQLLGKWILWWTRTAGTADVASVSLPHPPTPPVFQPTWTTPAPGNPPPGLMPLHWSPRPGFPDELLPKAGGGGEAGWSHGILRIRCSSC